MANSPLKVRHTSPKRDRRAAGAERDRDGGEGEVWGSGDLPSFTRLFFIHGGPSVNNICANNISTCCNVQPT